MELKTGFLTWWTLMMIQETTCRPACHFINRVNYTKTKMEDLLNKCLSGNGKNISQWQKPISELDLKSLSHEEKMQKARCGLDFMQKALHLINQHQRELHESKNFILEELMLTKHCVASHIGNCTNIPEPDFQSKETYKRKQWALAVLKSSVDFLDELVKIQHHTSSKLPPPKHA